MQYTTNQILCAIAVALALYLLYLKNKTSEFYRAVQQQGATGFLAAAAKSGQEAFHIRVKQRFLDAGQLISDAGQQFSDAGQQFSDAAKSAQRFAKSAGQRFLDAGQQFSDAAKSAQLFAKSGQEAFQFGACGNPSGAVSIPAGTCKQMAGAQEQFRFSDEREREIRERMRRERRERIERERRDRIERERIEIERERIREGREKGLANEKAMNRRNADLPSEAFGF